MTVEQDDWLGAELPLPASETGHAGHAGHESSEHPTVIAVLAARDQAKDALEKHTLAIIRVNARPIISALSLPESNVGGFFAQTPQTPLTSDLC
jgi:F420-dependent methylenetetrahydromethanopterin dehydrogenase